MLLFLIDLVISSWGSASRDWCTCVTVYLDLCIVRILINIGMFYSLNLNNC